MDSSMSPSDAKFLTSGQIGKFEEIFGDGLRKANIMSEAAQQVLQTQAPELVAELVLAVRRRVEQISSMIVRHVKVDRSRKPQQVLEATGRVKYTNDQVVKTMPRGAGEETDVFFFKIGRWISDADLEKEYDSRGLRPADPYSLAKINEDDPTFADEHPNGTHWQDSDDKWCFATFRRWHGRRHVYVSRRGIDWRDRWWFAGVRK